MTLADFPAAQIAHARDCDQFRNQTSALAVAMPFDNLRRAASVDELGAWLQEVHRAGIPGDAKAEVTTGFRSQLLQVEARG